jgi:hypothetical protein
MLQFPQPMDSNELEARETLIYSDINSFQFKRQVKKLLQIIKTSPERFSNGSEMKKHILDMDNISRQSSCPSAPKSIPEISTQLCCKIREKINTHKSNLPQCQKKLEMFLIQLKFSVFEEIKAIVEEEDLDTMATAQLKSDIINLACWEEVINRNRRLSYEVVQKIAPDSIYQEKDFAILKTQHTIAVIKLHKLLNEDTAVKDIIKEHLKKARTQYKRRELLAKKIEEEKRAQTAREEQRRLLEQQQREQQRAQEELDRKMKEETARKQRIQQDIEAQKRRRVQEQREEQRRYQQQLQEEEERENRRREQLLKQQREELERQQREKIRIAEENARREMERITEENARRERERIAYAREENARCERERCAYAREQQLRQRQEEELTVLLYRLYLQSQQQQQCYGYYPSRRYF